MKFSLLEEVRGGPVLVRDREWGVLDGNCHPFPNQGQGTLLTALEEDGPMVAPLAGPQCSETNAHH